MRTSVALAFLLLAACHKGWDWKAANQRYLMMLSNDASEQELCAEAKRDAKAALKRSTSRITNIGRRWRKRTAIQRGVRREAEIGVWVIE